MPRRALVVTGAVVAVLGVLAFLPSPTPRLDPGPVWRQTEHLSGATPTQEDVRRGKSYAPIGVVALDELLDLGWDTDPSGGTAIREFSFPDEVTARGAAAEAMAAGPRNDFTMQPGGLTRVTSAAWQSDGWGRDRKVHYVVTLLSPERPGGTWTVHLLLEHTY